VHISTLEANESGEDDEGRREDVADRNAINEDLLWHPAAKEHCLGMDERDCRICAAEGKAACDEAEDE